MYYESAWLPFVLAETGIHRLLYTLETLLINF
jgi:hypothetical protein